MKRPQPRELTAIRLRDDERNLFARAAEIEGKTLSEFMREAAKDRAVRTIAKNKDKQ